MSEMVERVARAIFDARPHHNPRKDGSLRVPEWGVQSDQTKAAFRRDARAAIEAMREPTEAQLVVANDLLHDHPHETSMNVYRVMIDAVLASEASHDRL